MRPPATFRHVCVIAREELTAAPGVEFSEWVARVTDRLLALGFTYPTEPDGVHRAVRAVERALMRTGWSPPTMPIPGPTAGKAGAEPAGWSHGEAVATMARYGLLCGPKAIPAPRPRVPSHAAAAWRAAQMVAGEIVASIARCEAAERAIAAAAAVEVGPPEPANVSHGTAVTAGLPVSSYDTATPSVVE